MAIYLRTAGGEPQPRVLLDAAKAHVEYEGSRYELRGATLDLYAVEWSVIPGTYSEEPAMVVLLRDELTGIRIELPLPIENADAIARALTDRPRPSRKQRRRRGG